MATCRIISVLLLLTCCVASDGVAAIQPPEFATTLKSEPTTARIFDAVETLAVRNHLPEYQPLEVVVHDLLNGPTFQTDVLSALTKYPVRSFLVDLTNLLPSDWQDLSDLQWAALAAIAKLRGIVAASILQNALSL